jgi:acetyltransferase-like isoleucine patch superfamily enzyme
MDSDYHKMTDLQGQTTNADEEVVVEDHVWIGCRCMIGKGTRIAGGTVVAAQSVVTGKFDQERVLLAGSPARVIKEGVGWER